MVEKENEAKYKQTEAASKLRPLSNNTQCKVENFN